MGMTGFLYQPPGVQLPERGDVRTADDNLRSIRTGGNGVSDGHDLSSVVQRRGHLGQFLCCQRALLLGDDYVCAVAAKLAAESALQVCVQSERGGGDGCNHRYRYKGSERAVFAYPGGSNQQPCQKAEAAQASPRRTTAGSKRMAL